MDVSSIAALSIDLSLARTQQAAELATIKNAMEIQNTLATELIESIPPVPQLASSGKLDIVV